MASSLSCFCRAAVASARLATYSLSESRARPSACTSTPTSSRASCAGKGQSNSPRAKCAAESVSDSSGRTIRCATTQTSSASRAKPARPIATSLRNAVRSGASSSSWPIEEATDQPLSPIGA